MLKDIYTSWNITSDHIVGDVFTGYESLYPQFDKFTNETYDADPEGTIEAVFELYRSINLVPITYYTEDGVVEAIREFQSAGYGVVKNNVLGLGNNKGQVINRFLFPNMMDAEPNGVKNNSLRDRFYHDVKLKRAIRICFEFRDGNKLVYPTAIRRALELVTGGNVTNFKAQNARAIVEYLCPVLWGKVYDYSCGYGGRMLGTVSSNMALSYVGVEPNTATVDGLNLLNDFLEMAVGRRGEVVQSVSEEYIPEGIDLAFSSPPYFNLEKYSDEDTQCMNRYGTLDEWFEGYAAPTMKNILGGLEDSGIFATNIADYKTGKTEYKVVDQWIATAEKVGFKHDKTIKMMLNTRPGVGNDKTKGREKWEGIYVFRK